jgi:S-(hydroxymethyl)glutathione dehydrogenase/alcohol dehydrogenase
MTKAAVLYATGQAVEVVDVSLGDVRDHDVLVRIMSSGVCHTDFSVREGALPMPTPMILGHEGAGIVEQVGAAVTGVREGDHVVFNGIMSCGQCRSCMAGKPNLCEWGLPTILGGRHPDGALRARDADDAELHQFVCCGTLAERAIVPEPSVIPIAKDVPFEIAALVGCGVLTGVGAVFNRARVHPGATVAVIGCGGVGLNVIQASRLVGAVTVIGVDPAPSKRDLATSLGATHTVDPGNEDVIERVLEYTGNRGADYAFECVGRGDLVRQAWDAISSAGTLVTIGVPPPGAVAELPGDAFWSTEKTLMCSLYGSGNPRVDIPLYIELYRQGRLKLQELVTRRYQLSEVNEAMADLEASRNARGVVVF